MIIDTDNIGETIDILIGYADPEGRNCRRLKKYKLDVQHRVMIGPAARRFIHSLVAKLDNIECEFLNFRGICRLSGAGDLKCNHAERYSVCTKYSPAKSYVKGGPDKGGV
ncbi:MAG: hypothetical protein KAV87_53110 [Desulfobacteraceae bacterium]|nr:hypothetical protein [Desulfobacteraceae bacterium]